MSPQDRAEFAKLTAEVTRLRRDTRLIPARWASPPDQFYMLVMGSGNTIATYGSANYYGLKYNTGATPTTVATSTPSTTPGALADNLSWATLYGPSGSTSTVWCGVRLQPDGTGTTHADMFSVIPLNTTFIAFRSVPMQVGSSGVYVPVYVPGRLA